MLSCDCNGIHKHHRCNRISATSKYLNFVIWIDQFVPLTFLKFTYRCRVYSFYGTYLPICIIDESSFCPVLPTSCCFYSFSSFFFCILFPFLLSPVLSSRGRQPLRKEILPSEGRGVESGQTRRGEETSSVSARCNCNCSSPSVSPPGARKNIFQSSSIVSPSLPSFLRALRYNTSLSFSLSFLSSLFFFVSYDNFLNLSSLSNSEVSFFVSFKNKARIFFFHKYTSYNKLNEVRANVDARLTTTPWITAIFSAAKKSAAACVIEKEVAAGVSSEELL